MGANDPHAVLSMLQREGYRTIKVNWIGERELIFDFSSIPYQATDQFIKGVIATLRAIGYSVMITTGFQPTQE